MEFLKALFGDKSLSYAELEQAINAHNGNEANKGNQLKIGNLGTGEYVSKLKYDDIVQQLSGKQTEIDTANGLIADLKKATKGDEALQGKVSAYETQVAQLQTQLAETKVKSALKVALLSEKALDIDYLTFKVNEKMKEQGKSLELDENENIKGWDEVISGLKTQFPTQFEKAGQTRVEPNRLPPRTEHVGISKEQFDKMGYQSRLKLKQEQPEVYAQMTGKSE